MKSTHRKLIELASRYDMEFVRSKKHLIFRHRVTGRLVTAASSASDHRFLANVHSHFRAASRTEGAPTLWPQA